MRKLIVVVTLILLVAVAGGVWVVISGWPPIVIRDRQYLELIAAFQKAQQRDHLSPGDENAGWDFHVQLAEKQTSVQVKAFPHMTVVRIKYSDEGAERALYKYVDYSHPKELRTAGNTLYVTWTETMFGTKYWLLAYDLLGRREITTRRVDPGDVARSQ
jgi:hypothetical protein